jgi:hypothetical protein
LDGQVVRLERLGDLADKFVRVRLTRIDGLNLELFEFDYDLTFCVFFLSADEEVYARYGGRDATGPDTRQSLAGLRHTMSSVLAMHGRKEKEFAPRKKGDPKTIRDVAGGRFRGCFHCHQVKEVLNERLRREGKWSREAAWRYPLPDNLGLLMEVDRGNVVRKVEPGSPGARAGLARGDVLRKLNGVPTHSEADAQFALDRAPARGTIPVAYERGGKAKSGSITLPEGWRKSDISWRPSLQDLVPSLPLYGTDLTPAEKKALGLSAEQLAFRHDRLVNSRAKAAGIQAGDVILGVDGRKLDGMKANGLLFWVRGEYLVGDVVKVDVLRGGKRLSLPLKLR